MTDTADLFHRLKHDQFFGKHGTIKASCGAICSFIGLALGMMSKGPTGRCLIGIELNSLEYFQNGRWKKAWAHASLGYGTLDFSPRIAMLGMPLQEYKTQDF